MFCPNCGKEITDETTKFCPECGSPLHSDIRPAQSTPIASTPDNALSNAMIAICIICAIVAIGIPLYCNWNDPNGQYLDMWWFEYAGGMRLTIIFAVVAVIAGIIGVFTRKKRV